MKSFIYRKAFKIMNWGCAFDSLLELKYAISIFRDYEFLRARVSIYYHPGTKKPTAYIKEFHRRYTPDFLIRHKGTGEAWLVEIKPRAFQHDPQLSLRKEVAENYIRWKGYDWKFRIVFSDEICLTPDEQEEFDRCCRFKQRSARRLWWGEYNVKFDRSAPPFFSTVPASSDIEYVMFGTRKKRIHSRLS